MADEILDHHEFLKTLSSTERAQLTRKSDFMGLRHLTVHWTAIAIVGCLIVWGVPGWQLLMIVQGILIVFLFTLLHETTHQTPFNSAELNTLVGYVCGFFIVLPSNWFQYFHLAHHRHTHDPEKDPELQSPKPKTWGEYLIYLSGVPVWISHIRTLLVNASGSCDDEFVPRVRLRTVKLEARFMIAIYVVTAAVSLYFASPVLIYIWVLPILLGQPFLRLYLLAEHGHCPHVANMFENTRTTFTSKLVRNLAWNMPFHAEHHAFPTVPFYLLPNLHEKTRKHLQVTEDGYRRFNNQYVAGFTEK